MKIKDIEKLIKVLEKSVVNEIEITDFWGRKIRINKTQSKIVPNPPQGFTAETKEESAQKVDVSTKNLVAIRSPIVGTFYRSPAPDAPPYVEAGDIIKPGQVVCIVEAMKLMNEIESDVAGRVVQILIKNEEAVEYNQELMLVEPL